MLVLALVFGMTIVGCNSGDEDNIPPEDKPVAERWSKYVDDTSTATLDYSVDGDGVCTITVGGKAEPHNETDGWYRWKVAVSYSYTAKAGKSYAYKFKAWTKSGDRDINAQYYGDDDEVYLYLSGLSITSEQKEYIVYGEVLPKGGIRKVDFQCADQLGVFYVKMLEIKEYTIGTQGGEPEEQTLITITNIPAAYNGKYATVAILETMDTVIAFNPPKRIANGKVENCEMQGQGGTLFGKNGAYYVYLLITEQPDVNSTDIYAGITASKKAVVKGSNIFSAYDLVPDITKVSSVAPDKPATNDFGTYTTKYLLGQPAKNITETIELSEGKFLIYDDEDGTTVDTRSFL